MKEALKGYSVGEVAGLSGVTVRTLHHYDRIGLLSPSGRLPNGYREYSEGDLDRLQQILFYRELGFALGNIADLLAESGMSRLDHLRRQHQLLVAGADRLQHMITSVENEMEAYKMGISLTPEERFEVFGDFDPDEHADEVEERWGDTDAYKESQRRVSSYTKADWEQIKADGAGIDEGLIEVKRAGLGPDSMEAMDLVERHRGHITRWFYECSVEMQRGLGQMYVADPRFKKRYDDLEPGLAEFVRDAIEANAARQGAEPPLA
ncbi:MAG TPA: MerR family transcriptional regulator [Actinomycetota bacterium]|nr:MerR family transcriptional regulator [Actinomycetota bacterium]